MRAGARAALAAVLFLGFAGFAQGNDGKAHGAAAAGAASALPFTFGGPFDLLDHTGRRRTDRDFRGRFLLIYFGYSICPDICPVNLAVMAEALDRLGDRAERVQPLFVTVDPGRDTAARLAEFVPRIHPRLIGLTGSEARIASIAKAYRVTRFKVPRPDEGADGYLVGHGPLTYLMGPDGQFVTFFRHDGSAEAMAKALRKYLDGAVNGGS